MKNIFSKINKKWLLLLITAVAAICCVMALNRYLPRPVGEWREKSLQIYEDVYGSLADRSFKITGKDGKVTWRSPVGFFIQDALTCDLDLDGEKELILLLWKIGKYGKHRPFWVERDELTFSQHVFIYSVTADGEIKHKWGASEIGKEIVRMKLMEKNASFIMTEDVSGKCVVWRWESFGLKTVDSDVSFVVFGDNIIHKEIYECANRQHDGSFDYLYEPFYEDIAAADLAAFQQETMLVDKESAVSGYPSFGSPLSVGEAIVRAGFDIASCAGNHALDRGIYGINVTTEFYGKNGIICLGVQNGEDNNYRPYELVSRNGISFALFDYTYGTGEMDVSDRYPNAVHYLPTTEDEEKEMIGDLQKARDEADFVIVFVHWGNEYDANISPEQKHMALVFADGGADVILGTHPHVVQDMEMVKRPDGGDMLVYYSLGNFRAHQGHSSETRSGGKALFKVEHSYDGVRIASYNLETIDSME